MAQAKPSLSRKQCRRLSKNTFVESNHLRKLSSKRTLSTRQPNKRETSAWQRKWSRRLCHTRICAAQDNKACVWTANTRLSHTRSKIQRRGPCLLMTNWNWHHQDQIQHQSHPRDLRCHLSNCHMTYSSRPLQQISKPMHKAHDMGSWWNLLSIRKAALGASQQTTQIVQGHLKLMLTLARILNCP